MKITQMLCLSCVVTFVSIGSVMAQVKTPAPSPFSEVKQVVGITDFTIQYSRPGVKDRAIYGDLVPFNEVWRTGANATTKISFSTDIEFGGKQVPAGEYVLFTIPGESEWTIILYGDLEVANAGVYDQANDVVRISVAPTPLQDTVESFTIGFDYLRDSSANLNLDWANTRISIPITVDTDALSLASVETAKENMDEWTARDYAGAAEAYSKSGKDPALALEWMGKAVAMNENAFWWLHRYANMLAEQGDVEGAIAAAEKSLAKARANEGGDFGYVQRNEELLSSLKK